MDDPIRRTTGGPQRRSGQGHDAFVFTGTVWFWRGPAPWHFVTPPDNQCQDLRELANDVSYGWGMIPVHAQIGESRWATSLFPKDDRYVLPIKTKVRIAEGIEVGKLVKVTMTVRPRSSHVDRSPAPD